LHEGFPAAFLRFDKRVELRQCFIPSREDVSDLALFGHWRHGGRELPKLAAIDARQIRRLLRARLEVGPSARPLRLVGEETLVEFLLIRAHDEDMVLMHAVYDLTAPNRAPPQLVEISAFREQHVAGTNPEAIDRILGTAIVFTSDKSMCPSWTLATPR
jgi:hypothetical protein